VCARAATRLSFHDLDLLHAAADFRATKIRLDHHAAQALPRSSPPTDPRISESPREALPTAPPSQITFSFAFAVPKFSIYLLRETREASPSVAGDESGERKGIRFSCSRRARESSRPESCDIGNGRRGERHIPLGSDAIDRDAANVDRTGTDDGSGYETPDTRPLTGYSSSGDADLMWATALSRSERGGVSPGSRRGERRSISDAIRTSSDESVSPVNRRSTGIVEAEASLLCDPESGHSIGTKASVHTVFVLFNVPRAPGAVAGGTCVWLTSFRRRQRSRTMDGCQHESFAKQKI
jgi:hypothetical protein